MCHKDSFLGTLLTIETTCFLMTFPHCLDVSLKLIYVKLIICVVWYSRMRGKMRFWSKTKHSEKKLSREKQASRSEAAETHGKIKSTYTHKQCAAFNLWLKIYTFHSNTKIYTFFYRTARTYFPCRQISVLAACLHKMFKGHDEKQNSSTQSTVCCCKEHYLIE